MPELPKTIRILLVDDHPIIREGIRACLEEAPHVVIVAEAGDGHDAIRLAGDLNPDIVVMDVNMPGLNGLAATAKLLVERPATRVLILTMHDQPEFVTEAIRVGARGCLSKDAIPQDLIRALETVARGEPHFAIEATVRFLRRYLPAPSCVIAPPLRPLTGREREVLSLVAEGLTNREISVRLSVGVRTVETYRERLMRKLDMHDTAALRSYASAQAMLAPASVNP